jgi:hypothetical protein
MCSLMYMQQLRPWNSIVQTLVKALLASFQKVSGVRNELEMLVATVTCTVRYSMKPSLSQAL